MLQCGALGGQWGQQGFSDALKVPVTLSGSGTLGTQASLVPLFSSQTPMDFGKVKAKLWVPHGLTTKGT